MNLENSNVIEYQYETKKVKLSSYEQSSLLQKIENMRDRFFSVGIIDREFVPVVLTDYQNTTFSVNIQNVLEVNPAYLMAFDFSDDNLAFLVAHELAHVSYNHLKTFDKIKELVSYNRSFLSHVSEKKLEPDTFFFMGLNHGFEYEADMLGQHLLREAGFEDVAVETVLKFGNLSDKIAQALVDTHPLPQDRAERLMTHSMENFSSVDSKRNFQYLSQIVDAVKENLSYSISKQAIELELEFAEKARQYVAETKWYILRNYIVICDSLQSSSVRQKKELYDVMQACERKYNVIMNNVSDKVLYGVVRSEYQDFLLVHKNIQNEIIKMPLQKLKANLKLLFVHKGKENEEHTI